jgi:hypothetical protein
MRFFFYCLAIDSAEKAFFLHESICLAEGLRELGIEFYSNINYWQTSLGEDDYLFKFDPTIMPEDCSVVIFDHHWFCNENPFPQEIFHKNRKYITVYLDWSDGNRTLGWEPEFQQFDFVLRSHFSTKFKHPKNFTPWGFGISQRILDKTSHALDFGDREQCLLVNFRNHPRYIHTVREAFYQKIAPQIQPVLPINDFTELLAVPSAGSYEHLLWLMTGRRHYSSYYDRLKRTAACACFGGYFEFPWNTYRMSRINYGLRRVLRRTGMKTQIVTQWDSWRLWESFAAGCATFHLDFEKYGFLLPVMPQNWQHYIGLDLDNIKVTMERLVEEPDILEKIANEGRTWAIKHYSPVPTAQRFLQTLQLDHTDSCIKKAQIG